MDLDSSVASDKENQMIQLDSFNPDIIERIIAEIQKDLGRKRSVRVKLLRELRVHFQKVSMLVENDANLQEKIITHFQKWEQLINETTRLGLSLSHPPSESSQIYDVIYDLGTYMEVIIIGAYTWCKSNKILFGDHVVGLLNLLLQISVENPSEWLYSVMISPLVLHITNAFLSQDHRKIRENWAKNNTRIIKKLAKAMFQCGDFMCQYYLMNVITGWASWSPTSRVLVVINDCFSAISSEERKIFLQHEDNNKRIRFFLNNLNNSHRCLKTVISIRCLFVFVGETELLPPLDDENPGISELWADFSAASGHLHIFYRLEDRPTFLSLSIRREQVDSICLNWVDNDGHSEGHDTQGFGKLYDTQSTSKVGNDELRGNDEKILYFHIWLNTDFENISTEVPSSSGRSVYLVFQSGQLAQRILTEMNYNIHTWRAPSCGRPTGLKLLVKSQNNSSFAQSWHSGSPPKGLDSSTPSVRSVRSSDVTEITSTIENTSKVTVSSSNTSFAEKISPKSTEEFGRRIKKIAGSPHFNRLKSPKASVTNPQSLNSIFERPPTPGGQFIASQSQESSPENCSTTTFQPELSKENGCSLSELPDPAEGNASFTSDKVMQNLTVQDRSHSVDELMSQELFKDVSPAFNDGSKNHSKENHRFQSLLSGSSLISNDALDENQPLSFQRTIEGKGQLPTASPVETPGGSGFYVSLTTPATTPKNNLSDSESLFELSPEIRIPSSRQSEISEDPLPLRVREKYGPVILRTPFEKLKQPDEIETVAGSNINSGETILPFPSRDFLLCSSPKPNFNRPVSPGCSEISGPVRHLNLTREIDLNESISSLPSSPDFNLEASSEHGDRSLSPVFNFSRSRPSTNAQSSESFQSKRQFDEEAASLENIFKSRLNLNARSPKRSLESKQQFDEEAGILNGDLESSLVINDKGTAPEKNLESKHQPNRSLGSRRMFNDEAEIPEGHLGSRLQMNGKPKSPKKSLEKRKVAKKIPRRKLGTILDDSFETRQELDTVAKKTPCYANAFKEEQGRKMRKSLDPEFDVYDPWTSSEMDEYRNKLFPKLKTYPGFKKSKAEHQLTARKQTLKRKKPDEEKELFLKLEKSAKERKSRSRSSESLVSSRTTDADGQKNTRRSSFFSRYIDGRKSKK